MAKKRSLVDAAPADEKQRAGTSAANAREIQPPFVVRNAGDLGAVHRPGFADNLDGLTLEPVTVRSFFPHSDKSRMRVYGSRCGSYFLRGGRFPVTVLLLRVSANADLSIRAFSAVDTMRTAAAPYSRRDVAGTIIHCKPSTS